MKHIITQNQVYVETEIHSVISTPVCHSSKGGPSSLEISRQLMFHPQGLPAVFSSRSWVVSMPVYIENLWKIVFEGLTHLEDGQSISEILTNMKIK